jgi:hypothetical protein
MKRKVIAIFCVLGLVALIIVPNLIANRDYNNCISKAITHEEASGIDAIGPIYVADDSNPGICEIYGVPKKEVLRQNKLFIPAPLQ